MSTQKPDLPYLLTRREVQALLRYGHSKIDEMIRDREIDSLKLGRSRRVFSASVNEWIESKKKK
jgi:excisionase family DNA binding protein